MDIQGRGAVVTGAGRGIGSAIARTLAENGATVVVSARSVDEIESVAKSLQSEGFEAHAIPCDVADETSVETMAQKVSGLIGDIDIVVNNAGIARSNPVKGLTLKEWNRILAVNATGTFLCTRAFLGGMIERGWGRVINVASVAGL
ncbi:MAG TPA: SDR family NAD(P)-dependent oxidoreductase, partial [Gemmatimonadetes bacterium]|nr:SDR family NAD(P)-dependent oxidoreductase [Gemmatimonadota bacterium]